MEYLLFIFVSLVVGAYLVWQVKSKEIEKLEKELELSECEIIEIQQVVSSLSGYNEKMAEMKENNKNRILAEIDEKGTVQTNEVMDLLQISRSTAYRYLEELEQEGKIVQIHSFGRNVRYKRVIK